ncbi:MAG: 50S ribosomal protein L9 [bacterium]
MKVILKEDVFKLGSLGDEVEVKRGFARNFLIPQGKALPLTRENVKQISHQRSILAKNRADAIAKAQNFARQLEATEIIFTMKSGDSGKLFGSVTQKHIYDALVEKGIDLDRKQLNLSNPIKTLGKHVLPVKLHTEVHVDLVVKVVAESDESTEAPAEGEPQSETSVAAGETAKKEVVENAG